ncbi:hypothetical protein F5882DRAFT_455014 [Hyaloscypha sp. PMI_1271]|nr:hypothetical protein F5882DRAFT_455014 [Hyaloscypha sp. PMI_1271]
MATQATNAGGADLINHYYWSSVNNKIIKLAEAFKKVNNSYKFSYLQLIVRKNGRLHTAKGPRREPNLSELYNIELLETKDRGPKVKAYELLKTYPHPNIAVYKGYRSTNRREKVNPRYLSKSDFLSSRRLSIDDATKACLDSILASIRHLHSLSIIHNNITPSNIMFEEDGTPVINDLGSYWKHDPRVQTTLEKNDLDTFTELQTWLIRSSADNFLFKRG